MTSDTVTVQRVEAVEVEVYNCPFCEQQFEDEEQMVEIGVDRREVAGSETRYQHQGTLCIGCAESIFGYERPSSSYNWTFVPDSMDPITWREIGIGIVGIVAVLGMISLLFAALGYFAGGAAEMFHTVLTAGGKRPSTTDVSTFEPIFFLMGGMMIVFAITTALRGDQDQ